MTFHAEQIAKLLARTIGDEKASALVDKAVGDLGFHHEALARAEALAVLEEISHEDGLVGISARFAKSRVHLLMGVE